MIDKDISRLFLGDLVRKNQLHYGTEFYRCTNITEAGITSSLKSGSSLGEKRKSLANMIQEELGEPTLVSGHLSRPVSRNAFSDVDPMGTPDSEVTQLHSGLNSIDGIQSRITTPGLVRVQGSGSSLSHTFASAVGSSIPRSTTPESHLTARAVGPGFPPVGGRGSLVDQNNVLDANTFNGLPSRTEDRASIAASLFGLSLSKTRLVDEVGHDLSQLKREFDVQPSFHIGMPNDHSQSLQNDLVKKTEAVTLPIPSIYKELANNHNLTDTSVSEMNSNAQSNFRKGTSASANVYKKGPYAGSASFDQAVRYQSTDMPDRSFPGHMPETYPINDGQDSVNHFDTGANFSISMGRSLDGNRNQVRSGSQVPIVDPLYVQCMQRASDHTAQAATSPQDPFSGRNYSHVDMIALHRAYLEALIAQQNPYGMPFLDKSSSLTHPYLRSPAFGHGMKHSRNLMARSIPSVVSGSPMLQNQRISSFPSMLRGTTGGSLGSWLSGDGEKVEESYGSSLFEEFKTNKARSFELSEIVDYVDFTEGGGFDDKGVSVGEGDKEVDISGKEPGEDPFGKSQTEKKQRLRNLLSEHGDNIPSGYSQKLLVAHSLFFEGMFLSLTCRASATLYH
ncbi:pumilio homolog 1-like [Papaver somniferum]|uniref:pumilio homolog 1-like n=1 Tax=Papaver somniferum TaxID=3469 RepID=UPI000E705DA9|nr:pumilio homolog 1-like [Papaver somniferum]